MLNKSSSQLPRLGDILFQPLEQFRHCTSAALFSVSLAFPIKMNTNEFVISMLHAVFSYYFYDFLSLFFSRPFCVVKYVFLGFRIVVSPISLLLLLLLGSLSFICVRWRWWNSHMCSAPPFLCCSGFMPTVAQRSSRFISETVKEIDCKCFVVSFYFK